MWSVGTQLAGEVKVVKMYACWLKIIVVLFACLYLKMETENIQPIALFGKIEFGPILVCISPQIWKFSDHKIPFSDAMISSQAPHFGNP